MKKWVKIALISAAVLVVGALVVWQLKKRGIIKSAIENAVSKGSGNDYYIHYDSSRIDEINGNASFYNIVLQSDSLQQKILQNDTSLSATMYNIRVGEVSIAGADIASMLTGKSVKATAIRIVNPVITIIKTGKEKENKLSQKDSLAIYQRLTGKYNSIQADKIEIIDGTIAFAKRDNAPHTTLQGVNIVLENLKVDSTRNFDNILSYFVKDIVATVKTFTSTNEETGDLISGNGIKYSAPGRRLTVDNILQKNEKSGVVKLQLKDNVIAGINTSMFIYNNKVQADSLISGGGTLNIYKAKKKESKQGTLEISNGFFDQAQVKNIKLGSTDLALFESATSNAKPLSIKNATFSASDIGTVSDGSSLQNIIAKSKWIFGADGFSLPANGNIYDIIIGKIKVDKVAGSIAVNEIKLSPRLSWQAYAKTLKAQKDLYDFTFKNIQVSGADIQALMGEEKLIANEIRLQPILRIYNDRTVPFDHSSKVGLYPHQQLQDLKMPVYVKTVKIINGDVMYRERGDKSKQSGDVSFRKLNATLSNVTNIRARIAQNNNLNLTATAYFLGVGKLNTTWILPLSKANAQFKASGSVGGFDATKLSAITEPLGMASIKRGKIKGLTFSMTGNDYHTDGEAVLKYEDLKIAVLKSEGDSTKELEKKGLISFAANLFVKNSNPKNGRLRTGEIDFDRDIEKSFFNLLWKSIFDASKRIAKGKDDK